MGQGSAINIDGARLVYDQFGERRSEPRHVAVVWVGKLCAIGTEETCIVRNISSTALVAQVVSPREVGDVVRIDLPRGSRLSGEVVWAGTASVEVRFGDPLDVSALVDVETLGDDAAVSERARLGISCHGRLDAGDESYDIEVRDLSQSGARILASPQLAVGQPMLLTIDGLGELAGHARWYEAGCSGISFLQPIPFDQLAHWVVDRETPIEQGAQCRRWPRYSMFFKTWLQLSDLHTPVEAYVHNISRGGMLATCRRGLHNGEHVVVELGQIGEVTGQVAWTQQERVGITFTRTIDADQIFHPTASQSVPPILHHYALGGRPAIKTINQRDG